MTRILCNHAVYRKSCKACRQQHRLRMSQLSAAALHGLVLEEVFPPAESPFLRDRREVSERMRAELDANLFARLSGPARHR